MRIEMKFDKYPYAKRLFIEVLYMDWIAPGLVLLGIISLAVAGIIFLYLR